MKRIHLMVAIVVATAATGCTNMTPQQESTAESTAVGAVAGGVVSNIKGGKQQ